ncbi:hypothetical protein K491DRAFT_711384 [Lophiostoma macrostomum CBS 122681]|uniref:Uncharacterized protein n=1 Tax=Lophiostoma macrostomum CBS 122681 TaxID=1314788 RepID=A0A6A6TQC0_9PLEO|nr:hypothetical protein K491DRAFT_711384 [Lophiostoma macrostomum CBS 122681]
MSSSWFDEGVINGSLWQNFFQAENMDATNGSILWTFPRADKDTGANITFFPNSTMDLQFSDVGQNLYMALPVMSALIDKEKELLYVSCIYPLSGQYSHLPRILFYVAIVFAFLLRHRTWLAEAALGIVMTYSATACIHLFVLLGFYDFFHAPKITLPSGGTYIAWDGVDASVFGDVDFWGIAPVIATSVIMLIPILHWSTSYHWNRGKAVIVYWAILIFVTFTICCILIIGWGDWWYLDVLPSVASCQKGCSSKRLDNDLFLTTLEDYMSDDCNCVDYCGAMSPRAPLRQKQGMQPLLMYESARKAYCKDKECYEPKMGTYKFTQIVQIFWIIALIQGILALPSAASSTEGVRDGLFRTLSAGRAAFISAIFKGRRRDTMLKRFGVSEVPETRFYRRGRRFIAKCIAALYYVHALFSLILTPFLFLATIAFGELFLGNISASERSDSVGSWGPWAVAGFALLATIGVRYHHIIANKIAIKANRTWNYIQYDADDRRRLEVEESQKLRFWHYTMNGFPHVWYVLKLAFWNLWMKMKLLRSWWKEPEKYSEAEDDHLKHNYAGLSGGEPLKDYYGLEAKTRFSRPSCSCAFCEDEKQSGEIPLHKLRHGSSADDIENRPSEDHEPREKRHTTVF